MNPMPLLKKKVLLEDKDIKDKKAPPKIKQESDDVCSCMGECSCMASKRTAAVTCPQCGKPVWDVATVDQALNKCWNCGARWMNDPDEVESSRKVSGSFTKKATGEPDQDYDHELYDQITNALSAEGFRASHREFDKYQGVYIKVDGDNVHEKFWTEDVFFTGEREGDPKATTFTYKPGTEQAHYIFYPESNPDVKIQYEPGGDVSEFVAFLESKRPQKKGAALSRVALKLWEHPADYMGEDYPDYYVGPGQSRDSDALERSNFKSALALLGGESEEVMVARFNHWAVGWVESILVHKDAKDKVAILQDIENKMADYPVLDDEDYSETEMAEYREDYESWARADALAMIKKHLAATAPAGDQDMVQRIEDYELSEKADSELGMAVEMCFMDHGEAYLDEKNLIEHADDAIATILQETGSKAQEDPGQMELPLEGLSSKQPAWTKTAKDWETCTNCGGDGHVDGKECLACEGTGRLPISKEASKRTARGEEKGQLILSYDQSDVADNQVKWLMEEPDEGNDYWMKDEVEEAWEKSGHDADKFKALLKQEGLEGEAEHQAQNAAYEDSDIYQFAWDDLKDGLSEALAAKNPDNLPWRLDGSNLGWQARSGYMYVETNDGQEFLNKVLPKTDVTIEVYDEGDALHFKVYHHDAPMGEHYYARPEAPKEGEEEMGTESSKRKSWTKIAALSKKAGVVKRLVTAMEEMGGGDIYYLHDQPMTCPKCGARTNFEEVPGAPVHTETHTCPECKYTFTAEAEPEDVKRCEDCGEELDIKSPAGALQYHYECPGCGKTYAQDVTASKRTADFEDEHGIADDEPAVENLLLDETPMEPEEGDVIIQGEGALGAETVAYADGKQIAKLHDDWDKFYGDIYAWMKQKNYYPNVWHLSDHGNYELDTDFGTYVTERQQRKKATRTAGYAVVRRDVAAEGELPPTDAGHMTDDMLGQVFLSEQPDTKDNEEFNTKLITAEGDEMWVNSIDFEFFESEDLAKAYLTKTAGRDEEIVKRNVELEQAAIDEYRGQAEDASPDLKKVLDHTIEQEREHRREFETKKVESAISPQERAQYTWMAKNLKSVLKPILGIPISVKTSGSVRPNPYIEVSSVDWETNKIPNDFRVKVAKALGIEPTSWENVTYGNITDNRVALPSTEWKKVLDSMGVAIPEQPVGEPPIKTAADQSYQGLGDFVGSYLEAALWSSNDESDESGGEPLDTNYDFSDIAPEDIERAKADCAEFQKQAGDLLSGMSEEQAGHDFWLTRNGHGAGFWDRGLGEVGDKLTEIAHSFGEVNIYVGDEGTLHFAGFQGDGMNKWAADGIRSYGPGKFGTIIDQIAWEMTMAGADEEVSNEGTSEWYGLLRDVTVEEAEKVAEELKVAPLNDAEKEWFRVHPFIIIGTGEQGFVAVNGFTNEVSASKLWNEIVADMTPEEEMGAEGALDDTTKCKSCGKDFDFTGLVYCPECADVIEKQERSYTERVRDPQFDVEAGLSDQVKSLRRKLKELDVDKADPSEIASTVDALEKLEKRLKDQQETRQQKKDERAKAAEEAQTVQAGLSDQVKSLRKKLKEIDVDKAEPAEIASTVDALEKLEKRLKEQQETRKTNKEEKAKEAEEAAKTEVTAAEFGTHGLGHGLDDLYVLPASPEEADSIIAFLKEQGRDFKWSNADVEGHAWYGKRFLDIPFGQDLQGEIEALTPGGQISTEAAITEMSFADVYAEELETTRDPHQAVENALSLWTGGVFDAVEGEQRQRMIEQAMNAIQAKGLAPSMSSLKIESATNEQVIQMFAADSFPKDKMPTWGTQNLKINKEPNGWSLINYATPIAYRSNDGQTFINTQKYSQTTSRIQSVLKQNMGSAAEVDEAGMRAAMRQTSAVESVDDGDKGLHGESSLGKRSDMLPQERGYEPLSTIYFSKPMSEDEQQALLDIIEKEFGVEGGLVGGMNAINLDTDNKEIVEAAVGLIGRDLVQETSVGSREASLNKTADGEQLNGYIGYYRGKQFETHAKTSYEAQQKMAKEHGIKKAYEITVVLAEKGGEEVTHKPQDIVGSMNKKAGMWGTLWKQLPNSDLEISIDAEDQAELKEKVAAGDTSDQLMYDVFEPVTGAGLMWVNPEDIGALTSAPILSDGTLDDSGHLRDEDGVNVWWYPNYAVRSPLEDLAETGKTIFTFAPEDKAVESSQKRYAKYFEQFKSSDLAGSAWELDAEARKLKRKKSALKIQSTEDFFKSGGYKFKEGDLVWLTSGDKATIMKRHAADVVADKEYDAIVLDGYGNQTGSAFKISEKDLEPA